MAKSSCFIAVAIGLLPALAGAREWQTVRIGTDATYPPFETVNSKGQIVGFEIEYAMALCARLNLSCRFVNQDWDGIIPALLTGKFDAIFSSMTVTEARKAKVIFSDVYYSTPPVFAAPASDHSDDISAAALKNKTIGTQSSTTFANYLAKFYPASSIKLYPTLQEANLDLASGRIDFVFGESVVEQNFIDTTGNGCCRVIGSVKRDPETLGFGVGAAFRPDDADLRDKFNRAIAELDADGTYKSIEKKYFQG